MPPKSIGIRISFSLSIYKKPIMTTYLQDHKGFVLGLLSDIEISMNTCRPSLTRRVYGFVRPILMKILENDKPNRSGWLGWPT
ncbi:hypothetical protein HanRHA438_Chr02g0062061 [Helianthus annuus]|nr:hypothetical protein HanRHA438_Chr02g0062061 [Helianthus annuus]